MVNSAGPAGGAEPVRDHWHAQALAYAAARRDPARWTRLQEGIAAYARGPASISRAAEVADVAEGLLEYALWRAGEKVSHAEPLATRQDLDAFWQSIGR